MLFSLIVDIREELGNRQRRESFDEEATRKHFITRQDCRNICRKVKCFKNHRHENDAISVDRIVTELRLEDPSPAIAYKAMGVKGEYLREDNFMLVVMTEFQATLFKKFSDVVCVDSTHNTNQYGYKLATFLVVDEYKNGKDPI